MKGLTGVTADSPDNRKNVQLSPQETRRTYGRSLCVSWETPPATPLDDVPQPLGAQTQPNYLPSVTKAKAVHECRDAPGHEIGWLCRRNVFLLGDEPPPAVGKHCPVVSTPSQS